MIKQVIGYSVACDGCDTTYIDEDRGYSAMGDPDTISEFAVADGWYVEETTGGQKCYCPDCHEINEEGALITKTHVDKSSLSTWLLTFLAIV